MLLPADFDRDDFLRNYWQKKPLLIRATDRRFRDPIEAEELAGLACEDFVESRLISSDASQQQWNLRNGPFTEEDFDALPESHWSLLVQAVDQYHDGVRAMLREFDFIPSWRIDDIMISFASDGGGVGPHFDYYDVFLIQGAGRKRWCLGGHADSNSPLIPDSELRLLRDFETQQEWIVEPGDILYLPPNVAHYGIALGDSITYSVGFRAPSVAQIIDDLSSEVMQDLPEDLRYVDSEPTRARRPGEIDAAIGTQLAEFLRKELLDEARLRHWFARYMTRPKYAVEHEVFDELHEHAELDEHDDFHDHEMHAHDLHDETHDACNCHQELDVAAMRHELATGGQLEKNPASRFAFTEDAGGVALYVDGQRLPCPPDIGAWVPRICANMSSQHWQQLFAEHAAGANLVTELYNQGSLLFADE